MATTKEISKAAADASEYSPSFISRQLERDREEALLYHNPMAGFNRRDALFEIAKSLLSLPIEDQLQLKQELEILCPRRQKVMEIIILWALRKTFRPSMSPADILAAFEQDGSASNQTPEAVSPT